MPIWGQSGKFIITLDKMRVHIELDGIFGITGSSCYWPGFSTHAVDLDQLFLSPTGYRSFLGIYAEPQPGLTPDEFTREVIAAHVAWELKGKLVAIEHRHRRIAERRPAARSPGSRARSHQQRLPTRAKAEVPTM